MEVQSPAACSAVAFVPTHTHLLGGYTDGSVRLVALGGSSVPAAVHAGMEPGWSRELAWPPPAGQDPAEGIEVVWVAARHATRVVAVAAHPQQPWALSAAA